MPRKRGRSQRMPERAVMGAKRIIAVAALAVALFSAGLGAEWIPHAPQHSALQEPSAQGKSIRLARPTST